MGFTEIPFFSSQNQSDDLTARCVTALNSVPYVQQNPRTRQHIPCIVQQGTSADVEPWLWLQPRGSQNLRLTHRPISSSFLGLPYRIPNISHNLGPMGKHAPRSMEAEGSGLASGGACAARFPEPHQKVSTPTHSVTDFLHLVTLENDRLFFPL